MCEIWPQSSRPVLLIYERAQSQYGQGNYRTKQCPFPAEMLAFIAKNPVWKSSRPLATWSGLAVSIRATNSEASVEFRPLRSSDLPRSVEPLYRLVHTVQSMARMPDLLGTEWSEVQDEPAGLLAAAPPRPHSSASASV